MPLETGRSATWHTPRARRGDRPAVENHLGKPRLTRSCRIVPGRACLALLRMEEIDHNAGEPVWSQLAGILRRQIERGTIQPGKLLPSISALMQIYGVSDGTVKRAIRALRDEGLVSTVPGRGSYVSE